MTLRQFSGSRRTALIAAAYGLAAAGLCGVLPGSRIGVAWAQQKPDAGPQFGSIDMQKAAEDSKLRQQNEEEWRTYAEGLDKALQRLASGSARLLSDAEIHELASLYEKPAPLGDADQKRLTALEQKADLAGQELAR